MKNKIIFKKIKFLNFNKKSFEKIIKRKGLFVFPSGPGLSSIDKNPLYYDALINANLVFFDSGYFVLLLKMLKNISVNKFSGYMFFKLFIEFLKKNKSFKILSIDPSKISSSSNIKLYKKIGLNKINFFNYVAPLYGKKSIYDYVLVKKINKIKPRYVIINIAGGKQEILGYFLKKNINHKCTILCTGAAIAYFSGDQAPMNIFFDKLYLGWLIRILFDPKVFLPRYLKTFSLFFIVLKNKATIR